jgi:energy-converting hydrogenase Eha subunit C
MSLFYATCQGIGLAVAAGTFAGASGRRGTVGALLAVLSAIGGGILFAVSLSNRDHPAWPGVPLGILIALLAFGVVSAVVAGAQARAKGASSIGLLVAAVALIVAVLSVFVEPVGLVAFLALLWLASARRRRAQRKYEGLRVLR